MCVAGNNQAQGLRWIGAGLQASQGNTGPINAMRANFQNTHGGMNVQQAIAARRANAVGMSVAGALQPSLAMRGR